MPTHPRKISAPCWWKENHYQRLPGFVATINTIYPKCFFDAHCIIFCSRVMGAAALQKYIGSLGGIGASGVGSSSSYSPKEMNKDIMPEKVSDYAS
jgi:hypothetical protein